MAECLATAAEMKEVTSWFHHPSEVPLRTDPTAMARNFFGPDASQISTKRLRGESVIDQFDLEVEDGPVTCQEALRNSLGAVMIDTSGEVDPEDNDESMEKEGKLSRSPSSVMLFEQTA